MAEFVTSIGAKISEYLVEPFVIRPLRPIFCFKSIVDDFQNEHEKLILAQEKVNDAVKEAKYSTREIYKQVDKWIKDANRTMEDAQRLQKKLEENKSCCFSSGWTCHYWLSKQAWEVTDSIKMLSETAGLLTQVAGPADLRQHIGLPFFEDFVVSNSAGSALCEILEALMNEDVNKIGLYGTGGAGKTTLAKQVFKEVERLRMFDRVVLVTVTHTADAIISIQDTIADFMNLELKQRSKDGRASQLYRRLANGEKILIILDDVREELDLGTVGIPSFGCCKVLLTTHDLHVCNSMQTQRDIRLGGLSEDEAWDLFKSVAGVGDRLRMFDVAKRVLMFSNGLPKALVTLGRKLRGKSYSQWEETLQKLKDDDFKIIMDDLHEEIEKLSLRKERVLNEITVAKNNSQVIEKDVEKWLTDVEKVVEDIEKLKGELNQDNICLGARDDIWSKRATLQKTIVQKLYDEGTFDRVAHPVAISQEMGLSFSKDFITSKSATLAFQEIMKALIKDDVTVIGLYGMGGIGKTTLAKQVAKEAERLKTFDRVVMVTVSQTLDVRRIQGVIADYLNLKLEQESEEGRASQLSQRLKSEKILIILDDLWKKFDLENIGIFGDECKGCKLMLTTRCIDVCASMDSQTNIQLKLLSEDEAWNLFKKKSLLSDDSKLNKVAKDVVRECNCLPIALASVGAALKNKNADEWKEALEKLRDARLVDIPAVGNDDKNAYKCLRLSYDYLKHSSDSQAQFLLLLCSLFPEDHEIDIEDLTSYAYGMDLFQRVNSIEVARRKVRVTVRLLKNSSLLLDTDDKEHVVKMHDMVRDVALWIGGTECPERSVFTVRDGIDLKDLMKKDIFQNCRAVSFMPDSIRELPNYKLAFPKLETMLIFGAKGKFIQLPDAFFKHVEALKVFDIRCHRKWTFSVPQSLKYLRNLRTLNLRDCKCSNCCMLGELRNLEILSLGFSEIDCGLEAFSDLKQLRLLDLTELRCGARSSLYVIKNFLKLEELYSLDSSSGEERDVSFSDDDDDERSNGCNLSCQNSYEIQGTNIDNDEMMHICNLCEVKSSPNFTRLFTRFESVKCLPIDLSFTDLDWYRIIVGRTKEAYRIYRGVDNNYLTSTFGGVRDLSFERIEDWSQVNAFRKLLPTVKKLTFYRLKERSKNMSPSWGNAQVGAFENLTSLKIWRSDGMTCLVDTSISSSVPTFVLFPNLVHLTLSRMVCLKALWHGPPPKELLQNLEELHVSHCDELEIVVYELQETFDIRKGPDTKSLCNLRQVRISSCSKLRCIFSTVSFAQNLQQLKILEIAECGDLEEVISSSAPNEDLSCCFQKLTRLEVIRCKKLKTIFLISTCAPSVLHLPNLQWLELDENEELEHVVKQQTEQLHHMDYSFTQWPSLRRLQVSDCPKLSSHVVQSQLQAAPDQGVQELISSPLIYLHLTHLANLNCIWSTGRTQNISFSYLLCINVSFCNSLKHLFTASIAQSLQNLERLNICDCIELEQIIVKDVQEEDDVNADSTDEKNMTTIITFPSLVSLTLINLPSLVRVCPANYILNLQSLERQDLDLKDCPNTITDFFSSQQVTLYGDAQKHRVQEIMDSDSDSSG